MNALVCIGCNTYDHLDCLEGAEKDAKTAFDLLRHEPEDYHNDSSRLLISPTLLAVNEALSQCLQASAALDAFTFFFAGHAVVKAGSLYLCLRDSHADRLSISGFPIGQLFFITNEFQPRQVNIVIDACQAGGSSFDLAQLLKPEVVGHSEAPSISFLGACSSNEYAGETKDGGNLTRHLLKYLTGEKRAQTKSPTLALTDLSAIVCREVHSNHPTQKPISWGLSLFGSGFFARNPHFDFGAPESSFHVDSVSPESEVGKRIRANSSAIWTEYRTIKEDPNPRRLLDLLDSVFSEATHDLNTMIASVHGLADTMGTGAQESSEMLARSQCLASCAVALLPHIDSDAVKAYTIKTFREIIALDFEVWRELLDSMKCESSLLLSDVGVMADLYYLPLRLSKILGWIGFSLLVERMIPELNDGNDPLRIELATALVGRYAKSLVAVSDEQAPYLYVFLRACELNGHTQLAEFVTNFYFTSFAEKKGNVTRTDADGIQAFRYIQSLGREENRPQDWRPANPSHLLPVLLVFGAKLGLGQNWDLRVLDRTHCAFYIPDDYRKFGRKLIDTGMNYTRQIGFPIFSASAFNKEFQRAMNESFSPDTRSFSREGIALCVAASLLFPDRLPLLVEARI